MEYPRMKIQSLLVTVSILWLFLSSCSTLPLATDEPTETALQTPAPTMTSSLTPESTETPLWTSTPVSIHTPPPPTLTVFPTPTTDLPTPTPLPTLTAEEAKKMILGLLEDNGGCRLPCWWGLTPGETSVQATKSFLGMFEEIAITNIFDEFGAYSRWLINEGTLILDIRVEVSSDEEMPQIGKVFWVTTQVNRELEEGGFEVVWENPLNAAYLQTYMLPQILTTYGPPNDVQVFGLRSVGHGNQPLFELILDYADQGFAIWYTAPMERVGDTYLGCIANAYTNLHLWDPKLDYTWAEGVTRTSGGEDWEIDSLNKDFLSLEEATSMTLDEFFQTFKNPKNTTCLETPVEIWPGP